MYLISPDKPQFKANLHSHSTCSDGKKTPLQLKEAYKAHGYQILAITDHEYPCHHQDLNEPGFMMLTGYEAYIRDNKDGLYDVYGEEVHLNLFARDPHNETMICNDPRYGGYLERSGRTNIPLAGSKEPRQYTHDYLRYFIATAQQNGYLVAYNHPYWSWVSKEDVLAAEGCFSMEMINYNSYVMNHLEYNAALYDHLLRAGKRLYCHGVDDNHNFFPDDSPHCDSYGGFTMIMAEELTYSKVIEAMEKGEMYASMGPQIHSISVEGNKLRVTCSEAAHLFLFTGSKAPERVHALPGESLVEAEFTIPARALYVRVCVEDHQGRRADTRGFSREEFGFPPAAE